MALVSATEDDTLEEGLNEADGDADEDGDVEEEGDEDVEEDGDCEAEGEFKISSSLIRYKPLLELF